MPNPKSQRSGKAKPKPGLSLELLVAKIQKAIDPASVVTHDEKIIDKYGIARQFDVVVRGMFAGRPMIGVIECKDHGRRKNMDAVEAFAKKAENAGANLKIMVSRKGFAKNALKLAHKEFITCMSVLSDFGSTRLSIGSFWYGLNKTWDPIVGVQLGFAVTPAPVRDFVIRQLKLDGKLLLLAFLRDLFQNHNDTPDGKVLTIDYAFIMPTSVEVDGLEYPMKSVQFRAKRIHRQKRIWVQWTGEAFFDWNRSTLTIPVGNTIVGSCVPTDLSEWPDYHGPLPPASPAGSSDILTAYLIRDNAWNSVEDNAAADLRIGERVTKSVAMS